MAPLLIALGFIAALIALTIFAHKVCQQRERHAYRRGFHSGQYHSGTPVTSSGWRRLHSPALTSEFIEADER